MGQLLNKTCRDGALPHTHRYKLFFTNFSQDLNQKKYQADSCIRDLKSKLATLDEVL